MKFLWIPLLLFSLLATAQETFIYDHAVVWTSQGKVDVEVADTPQKRAQGLGFRRELLPGKGMLFVFQERHPHSFWMKGMKIPLDIIWLDNHLVVHVERRVPPPSPSNESPPTMVPSKAANFVLEVGAGQADLLGLSVGKTVRYQF